MRTHFDDTTPPIAARTRRHVLRAGGGLALATFTLAAPGGQQAVAQEGEADASPAAAAGLEGQYAVIRLRRLKPDRSAAELADLIRDGFLPLTQAVPGFVSYLGVIDEATGDQFSLTVFADQAGADEANRLATEWGETSGANDYVEGEPTVAQGVIAIVDPVEA